MVCPLCKYASMYLNFHMLTLPSVEFCLFCLFFCISVWSPHLRLSMTQIWEASLLSMFMMPHPSLTTPRSFLIPALLIAPTQAIMLTIFVFVIIQRHITHFWLGDNFPPQQWLWMDAWPAKSGPFLILLQDTLPFHANSDANAHRAKVTPQNNLHAHN